MSAIERQGGADLIAVENRDIAGSAPALRAQRAVPGSSAPNLRAADLARPARSSRVAREPTSCWICVSVMPCCRSSARMRTGHGRVGHGDCDDKLGDEALVARPAFSRPARRAPRRCWPRSIACGAACACSSSRGMLAARQQAHRGDFRLPSCGALGRLFGSALRRRASGGLRPRSSSRVRPVLDRLTLHAPLRLRAWSAAASRGSCFRSRARSPDAPSRNSRALSLPWPMRSPL